jgi:hypothetical protein
MSEISSALFRPTYRRLCAAVTALPDLNYMLRYFHMMDSVVFHQLALTYCTSKQLKQTNKFLYEISCFSDRPSSCNSGK